MTLDELELEKILSRYPQILREQLETLLQNTQKEYEELQSYLLTKREKMQASLHQISKRIFMGVSAAGQMVFSEGAKAVIKTITTIDPDSTNLDKLEAEKLLNEKIKQLVELNARIKENIVSFTVSLNKLEKPPESSLWTDLTAICCGYKKEELAWFRLDAKIHLLNAICQNMDKLIKPKIAVNNIPKINGIQLSNFSNGIHSRIDCKISL